MLFNFNPILDELKIIDADVKASQAGAAVGLTAIVDELKTISGQLAQLITLNTPEIKIR